MNDKNTDCLGSSYAPKYPSQEELTQTYKKAGASSNLRSGRPQ